MKTRSRLSVSFDYNSRIRICILKSGNGVAQVEPPKSKADLEQIITVYKSLRKQLEKT